jgi:hypothetical protein
MKLIEKEDDEHSNIIVAGSRTFTDYNIAKSVLTNFISTGNINSPTIISGMANGADMLGYNFAKEFDLQIKEYPADWNTYQNRAGYIRNEQMAKYASENGKGILIAFWDGESNGTKHMIELAKKYKLEVHVFDFKGEEYGQ